MNARLPLVLSGLAILVGGLLHPLVPHSEADQAKLMASSTTWVVSHWILTIGQAAALVAVPLLARSVARQALTMGLAFGTLGTLLAATALPAAAGDSSFHAWSSATVAIGWISLPLAGTGAILLARARPDIPPWLRITTLVGGLAAVAGAVAALPWPWVTHQFALRIGAIALGLGLLVWSRFIPPEPAATTRP